VAATEFSHVSVSKVAFQAAQNVGTACNGSEQDGVVAGIVEHNRFRDRRLDQLGNAANEL
jgi:hypothetical protein